MPLRALLAALLLSLPPAAPGQDRGRGDVSDEVVAGSGPTSPTAPRTRQVSNALEASVVAGPGLAVDLGLGVTWLEDAATDLRRQSGQSSQPVLDLGAGLLWEATEHLGLDLALGWSPRSRLVSESQIAYRGSSGPTQADALVVAHGSKVSAEVGASWDTAGYSDFETGVDLAIAGRRYDSDQQLVLLRDQSGQLLTPEQLIQDLLPQCRAPGKGKGCPQQALGLLRQQPAALHQMVLKVAAAETLWLDTEVGLAWRWYLYDRDPTEVGFFRLADAGRSGGEFGSGLAMAPLAWSLRPSLAHRLGRFTVRAWWEHGSYVQGLGSLDTAALRVQVRLGSGFRLWAGAAVQRDRETEGKTATLGSGSLGALMRW